MLVRRASVALRDECFQRGEHLISDVLVEGWQFLQRHEDSGIDISILENYRKEHFYLEVEVSAYLDQGRRKREYRVFIKALPEGHDEAIAHPHQGSHRNARGTWSENDDPVLVSVRQPVNPPQWVRVRLLSLIGLKVLDDGLGRGDDAAQLIGPLGSIPRGVIEDWELDLVGFFRVPRHQRPHQMINRGAKSSGELTDAMAEFVRQWRSPTEFEANCLTKLRVALNDAFVWVIFPESREFCVERCQVFMRPIELTEGAFEPIHVIDLGDGV